MKALFTNELHPLYKLYFMHFRGGCVSRGWSSLRWMMTLFSWTFVWAHHFKNESDFNRIFDTLGRSLTLLSSSFAYHKTRNKFMACNKFIFFYLNNIFICTINFTYSHYIKNVVRVTLVTNSNLCWAKVLMFRTLLDRFQATNIQKQLNFINFILFYSMLLSRAYQSHFELSSKFTLLI